MSNRSKDEKNIASIVMKLSEENKRYVVAVANALLFTQEKEKAESACKSSLGRTT